jgi:hypothetical protein
MITCLDGLIFISVLLTKEKELKLAKKVDDVIVELEKLLDDPFI